MIEKGTAWIKHTGRFVLDGYFRLAEQGTAFTGLTPIADNLHLYAKDSSGVTELFYKNSAGTERNLSGGLTGAGTANRLAYWSAAQVLDDVAALTQHRLLVADANGLPTNGNALAVGSVLFGGTNGIPEDDNTKFFWNDTQKALIVGHSAAKSTSSTLEVITTATGDPRGLTSAQYSGDSVGSQINLLKARGTFAAPTAVLSGDTLGNIGFRGWGQTTTVSHRGAYIAAIAAQNFSDTVAGTDLAFGTIPIGSITVAERWKISDVGNLIGTGGRTIIGGQASLETLTLQGSNHANGGFLVLNTDTITSTSAAALGITSRPTFNGSGDVPISCDIRPTFTPTTNLTEAITIFCQGIYTPPTGVTISNAENTAFRIATGNDVGVITKAVAIVAFAPSLGTLKPVTIIGVEARIQGAAGVTNGIGMQISAQAGATNNYDMSFLTVDTTAAGAYFGRVPILYNGLLKYLHVFSA